MSERTFTRLDEIELEPMGDGKFGVTKWPHGLRNSNPNMLDEEMERYNAQLKKLKDPHHDR